MNTISPLLLEMEKERHPHFQEAILYEYARPMTKPLLDYHQTTTFNQQPQQCKPRGSGVFFEEREVKETMHPLQNVCEETYCEHSMPPPSPPPLGQPLLAPPVLATSIITEENEDVGPPVHRETYLGMWGDRSKHASADRNNGGGGDSLMEMKRNALRQRLHSRDYRLSTDELVFVEAAAKLSVAPQEHRGNSLISQQQVPPSLRAAAQPQQQAYNNAPRGVALALPLKKPVLPGNDFAQYPIDLALRNQLYR